MTARNFDSVGETRVDEVSRGSAHPMVLAGSAFALGLVTGLIMKRSAEEIGERVRAKRAHDEHERTVTYDENLPDSLSRREPSPHPGQPRFGGTGALGVSPASAPARGTDKA